MSTIQEIFDEKGIEYYANPNKPEEINIRCFSGLHEDSNPSLSYNIEKEVFNCFACGFKGNKMTLMKELGIHITQNALTKQGFKINRLRDKLTKLQSAVPLRLPEPRTEVNFDFKGISAKTLKNFGAFTTSHDGLDNYICVPVYKHGKLKFIEGRYSSEEVSEGSPKYLRKPTGVEVDTMLFPLDKITDATQLILVEGLFDVLNLQDMGYENSLCIFGANNFSPNKARVLDELGCRHVIIMMDGDSAGRLAATKIKNLLEQRNIYTTDIQLPANKDPGSLTVEEASDILSSFFLD